MGPDITAFFDEASNTISYVVRDPNGSACAIIDSVLDFDFASGRTDRQSADKLIRFVKENKLDVIFMGFGVRTSWNILMNIVKLCLHLTFFIVVS